MSLKKSILRLFSLPTEMKISEVKMILEHFGYKLVSVNGSHFQFKNEGLMKLTIPAHNGHVKKVYLKIIKRNIMPLL